jgi:putative molybdopterin biosynthesis protein
MGIAAAAQALDLDFIPLFDERYDLVIPETYYLDDLLMPLWEVLEDKAFRQAIAALPGYDLGPMGSLIAQIQ